MAGIHGTDARVGVGVGVVRERERGREKTKEGRVLVMTKSGCFSCDITFNVQNDSKYLTLTISGELC